MLIIYDKRLIDILRQVSRISVKFIFVCLFDGFSATFNNISVISWQSVLLVEETGEPGENHRPVASMTRRIMKRKWKQWRSKTNQHDPSLNSLNTKNTMGRPKNVAESNRLLGSQLHPPDDWISKEYTDINKQLQQLKTCTDSLQPYKIS